jgi:hypothetical protein
VQNNEQTQSQSQSQSQSQNHSLGLSQSQSPTSSLSQAHPDHPRLSDLGISQDCESARFILSFYNIHNPVLLPLVVTVRWPIVPSPSLPIPSLPFPSLPVRQDTQHRHGAGRRTGLLQSPTTGCGGRTMKGMWARTSDSDVEIASKDGPVLVVMPRRRLSDFVFSSIANSAAMGHPSV